MDESQGNESQADSLYEQSLTILNQVKIDYSGLHRDQKENNNEQIEFDFIENLNTINLDLEKLSPHVKSFDKLDDVESKLKESANEFDLARKEAKEAKERFNSVKQERYLLFNLDLIYSTLHTSIFRRVSVKSTKILP